MRCVLCALCVCALCEGGWGAGGSPASPLPPPANHLSSMLAGVQAAAPEDKPAPKEVLECRTQLLARVSSLHVVAVQGCRPHRSVLASGRTRGLKGPPASACMRRCPGRHHPRLTPAAAQLATLGAAAAAAPGSSLPTRLPTVLRLPALPAALGHQAWKAWKLPVCSLEKPVTVASIYTCSEHAD